MVWFRLVAVLVQISCLFGSDFGVLVQTPHSEQDCCALKWKFSKE
jgi:hypothetical protein